MATDQEVGGSSPSGCAIVRGFRFALRGLPTKREVDAIVPTIVGYANEGILDGILARGDKTLFGNEALEQRLHLNMERQWQRLIG